MLGLLLLPSLAHAGGLDANIPYTEYHLDNGLQVLLVEDHRLPLVSLETWYHVGAKNEVPGRTGFAHLFEHIMFQGARDIPEDTWFPMLEGVGASMVNGTTDFDRTNYFETLPSNQIALALWMESDRMGFLLDTLTQARLDNQRDVVRKERQQSTENVPYGIAEERFFKLLFPAPHPYNGVVIGSHHDLEAATLDDVKSFFSTYYAPNNATLVIVGDIDADATMALVHKYYDDIPRHADKPVLDVKTEPITSQRRESLTDHVQLPKVYLGWVTSPDFQPGDAELTLAASVLGDGKSSRLYTELVDKQQIAQSVTCYQYPLDLGSVFAIEVLGKPGEDPQKLEDAAWAVVQKLEADAPTDAELSRALHTWQASTLRGLESLGGFGGKADVLNYYNQHTGDPGYLPKDIARMEAVTADSMKQVLNQQIRQDDRVVVQVTPIADRGEQ
ncbi:MAG: insulinase family protein [Oligoflexia bacterium]|nr:insulinase family protein [Oligoflexia bacterium]